MNFDRAVEIVFDQEGGFSNDKDDPGGATQLGITEQTFTDAQQKGIVPHDLTLAELDKERAKLIYLEMYWKPVGGDSLPWPIALAAFDAAVNMGVKKAIGMLQQAVGTRIDGVVGQDTIKAAESAPSASLDRMLASRVVFYSDLVALKPVMRKYFFGWIRRCFTISREATKA